MTTREPGGTALGNRLRAAFVEPGAPIDPVAEAFVVNASRAQHVAEVIEPALAAGAWVLCDRYADATLAYQGFGRGVGLDVLRTLAAIATRGRMPDLTLLLDVSVATSHARVGERERESGVAIDRLEREDGAFHARVRDGYLALARDDARFIVLGWRASAGGRRARGDLRTRVEVRLVRGVEGIFDVVGAHAALAYFTTLEPKRLAHGYLFTGPAGVGKKTFALRLAQSLLCETPKATVLGYCESCVACTLFAAGSHPDLFSARGTIKIGGDDTPLREGEVSSRDLVRALALHGYRSRFRVVLLGDVDFATPESANALLRFFEEPPAAVIVILTSNVSGALLPTIRSRFVQLAFAPLPVADVERVLAAGGVIPERARFAAEAALGSVTRAREILDGDELGMREAAFAWFASAVRGEPADANFLRLDDRSLSGMEKRALVGELIELVRVGVRDWAALALGNGDVPSLAPDQRDRIASLPKRDTKVLASVLAALVDVQRLTESNVTAGLVVDYLRVQLAPR